MTKECYFFVALWTNAGHGPFILPVSRSHTQRLTQSVGLLWTGDQLYLTTHDTHNRQISMPPAGFEPTVSADERRHTYALDRAATGTGVIIYLQRQIS